MPTWLAVVVGITTAVGGLIAIAAVIVKYVVMPNLREQLVKPVTDALDGVTKAFDEHLAWSGAFELAVRTKLPDLPEVRVPRRY